MRVGERLLAAGRLCETRLEDALTRQAQTGSRLGDILWRHGHVTCLELYQALADQHARELVNLRETPPDLRLLDADQMADYLSLKALPYRNIDGVIYIATAEITPDVQQWAERHFAVHRFALTTPRDIEHAIDAHFHPHLTHHARMLLWEQNPHLSARVTFTPLATFLTATLIIAALIELAVFPQAAMAYGVLAINLFYLASLLFKAWLFEEGRRFATKLARRRAYPPVPDADLPVYTVLVPVYREADALPHLFAALRRINYPRDRLDIKLIIEADDAATWNAARALRPEGMIELLRVPPSYPRTKPKACNYALRFARGEFITIYDAEDNPDPLQLRQAVAAFRNGPTNLACLQARLNYYNRDDNWLTRLFAIEYAGWFDYLLPALDRHRFPIPLGGTSNHLSLARLREAGEWDPFNVTEDADLGIRLAAHGYETQTLNSLTLEEAPHRLRDWLGQRSRWIKGYMQTWLVHMRHPVKLLAGLGLRRCLAFQLFIGGPSLIFLSAPMLYGFAIAGAAGWLPLTHPIWEVVYPLTWLSLIYSLGLHCYIGIRTVRDLRWTNMAGAVAAYPFYWLLHSIAGIRALWQLLTRPHHWQKTAHGHSEALRSGQTA